MKPSLKYLLEVSIALSEDADKKVKKTAKAALKRYMQNNHNISERQLSDIIIENLNLLLSRFPRLLNSLDIDNQLNSGLNLLKGYIRLLTTGQSGEQKLVQYISCPIVMNRFAVSLLEIFKMENRSVNLLDDCAVRGLFIFFSTMFLMPRSY